MFDVDNWVFPFALLAILACLRLAIYVYNRLYAQTPAPVTPALTPDEIAEPAVTAMMESDAALAPPVTVATPNQSDDKEASAPRFIAELLDSGIIAVILVFFIIRPFILQAFFIPTGSMVPTLREGDRLLATKFVYHVHPPRHGDIVIFDAPEVALRMEGKPYDQSKPVEYVKRVIGVRGDHIRIKRYEGVYVNGERLNEPYIHEVPNYDFPLVSNGNLSVTDPEVKEQLRPNIKDGELIVPDGYLFVLGDNRTDSHDGHYWGLLKRNRVIGKAFFIFWPFERKGLIR